MYRGTMSVRSQATGRLAATVVVVVAFFLPTHAATPESSARALLAKAAAAMGGDAALRAIRSTKIEGIGHRNLLEQSERPEGPWIVEYEQLTEWRDFAGKRFRQTYNTRGLDDTSWAEASLV